MKVTVYTKSAGNLELDLKDGLKPGPVMATDGGYVRGFIQLGETEDGPVIVREDELVAIAPTRELDRPA